MCMDHATRLASSLMCLCDFPAQHTLLPEQVSPCSSAVTGVTPVPGLSFVRAVMVRTVIAVSDPVCLANMLDWQRWCPEWLLLLLQLLQLQTGIHASQLCYHVT